MRKSVCRRLTYEEADEPFFPLEMVNRLPYEIRMKIANEAMKHWYLMKRTWEFESLPFVTLGLPVCFYQINEEIIHIHDAQRCGCNFCAHELLKKWMHDHDEEHNFETDYALYELTESDSDGDLLVVFDGQMITNI